MTVTPRAAASWTAKVPTPPAAPWMRSVSPALTRSCFSTAYAVPPAPASDPATSQAISWGLRTRLVGSASAYSANDGVTELPKTSSPTANSLTPGPTWATTPDTSAPTPAGRVSAISLRMRPMTVFASMGLTPAARTATRTCPCPAVGAGTPIPRRTSGSPYSANRAIRVIYHSDLVSFVSLQLSLAAVDEQLGSGHEAAL